VASLQLLTILILMYPRPAMTAALLT